MNGILTRCDWANQQPLTIYHDTEWGVTVHDDQKLFEVITLDGMQAGLSWITILKKREQYRKQFDNFDVQKISQYDETKISQLLCDPGIIRNKLKINSVINNSKCFLKIKDEFGSFDEYFWGLVDNKRTVNSYSKWGEIPSWSKCSKFMSDDLKQKGFSFVGPTICYAIMQSIGMVNDHIVSCFRYSEIN